MKFHFILFFLSTIVSIADSLKNDASPGQENASTLTELASIDIGEAGAAEVTAYDPLTKRLFVVTNARSGSQIDVLDFSDPSTPEKIGVIPINPFGAGVNSISIWEGKLAAAVEAFVKTDPGKVVIFNTHDYSVFKQIQVGALPDMITFSYDGNYILTANEGEPSADYKIDPLGTVSIISVKDNYAVTTIDFSPFASQRESLQAKGLRIFGPGASFAQDLEPEYITISADSRTAWVTLQENNAIAKIDILARTVTHLFPLGYKNFNVDENAIDPSDKDNLLLSNKWPVKGMYQPDAIAVVDHLGIPFLFTANEGDQREYPGFNEVKRVKELLLDAGAFTDGTLRQDSKLGRLNVTTTSGDADNDGDFDDLESFGARSFSVWNGLDGRQLWDSNNQLEEKAIEAGCCDGGRCDDKGIEPEGLTLGSIGNKLIAFVGLERADAMVVYDVTDPYKPKYIKLLKTGDAPEGITFIPATVSPIHKSIVVVGSENDGVIKVYKTE